MDRRITFLTAVCAFVIAGLTGFYLGYSQCGGPSAPRLAASTTALVSTLVLGSAQLFITRSKNKAGIVLAYGILGYYVGGSLGWVHYIAPDTLREVLKEFVHGFAGGCY
jgi:hypothetical protein